MHRRLIAHRGWRSRYPENTLAAIAGAIDAGARAIEIDVQLSADRVPVLFHDRSLWRICRKRGRVSQYPASKLQGFSAGEPGRFGRRFESECIPSLQQVVALLRQHPQVHLFLEIKAEALEHTDPADAFRQIAREVAPLEGRCTLISFVLKALHAARAEGWPQLGPVLRRWRQLQGHHIKTLAPGVVFCDWKQLPPGPVQCPWPLALYEVADPAQARALLTRGASWIETFEIGEMIEAMAP